MIYSIVLSHVITSGYLGHIRSITALHNLHCGHQLRHDLFIFVAEWEVWCYAHFVSDEVDISLGFILAGRCPSRYDGSDGILFVPTYVTS